VHVYTIAEDGQMQQSRAVGWMHACIRLGLKLTPVVLHYGMHSSAVFAECGVDDCYSVGLGLGLDAGLHAESENKACFCI
jgi:hypothetical protein